MTEFKNGDLVEVRLGGDEQWYLGKLDGKVRKKETILFDHDFLEFANECEIVEMRKK